MATTKSLTVEEFEGMSLPHSQFELIEGELIEMSPAGRRATKTAALIVYLLTNHVRPGALGEVTGADGGFVLFPGRRIVRVPDAAFVRAERLVELDEDGFYRLAPDLAVEVISPTDRMADVLDKVGMYLEAGVRLVWLVDPRARTVAAYEPDGTASTLREGDELRGGNMLPEFRVAVAELFASARGRTDLRAILVAECRHRWRRTRRARTRARTQHPGPGGEEGWRRSS